MISSEQLVKSGVSTSNAAKFIVAINDTITKYEINSKLRICHFLSQILHESQMLQVMSENLNYSVEGLLATFPTHFTHESAVIYAHHPQAVANHVYANRMGNGDENSGDGYRYRGQGAIETTGKEEYQHLSKRLGIDVVSHPELLQLPLNALHSAGIFWVDHGLNHLADVDNTVGIRRMINGGKIGLPETEKLLAKLKDIL